ncbi:hypothetical protein QBC34DRAFT_433728 [Podospora aff. communis PSN243]|uniref:Swi5-dependent recombination DNA repair protein 1 n=1 Tax=Podospora aff. communis PSN243 TaxID=3040156 RepID=A0AAV9H2C3_9PEZI|nr:hypothetical protein QBC34DRAFT_433728 [Podospora aff. communis PSN243]
MSSNTPEPSAKRRRVEAANSTLRKPFKSPLIKRPANPNLTSTPTPRTTGAGTAGRNVFDGPASGSGIAGIRISSPSPLRFTPVTPNLKRRSMSPTKGRRTAGSREGGDGDTLQDQLRKIQRETAARIRAAEAELEVVEQAVQIRQESEAKRPGEEIDAELKELVGKWKGASRMAAEELFELIKGRVERMGGTKGMLRRREGYYGGGDDAERRGGEEREGNESDGEREDDGDREEVEEENENQGFTMLAMLKSLNIEPELLGWDPSEEKWLD